MPGSPVSRPVTTTGGPKLAAARSPGASTRTTASARADRLAFMRREIAEGGNRRDHVSHSAIGERGEKKGGAARRGEGLREGEPSGAGGGGPEGAVRGMRGLGGVGGVAGLNQGMPSADGGGRPCSSASA